MINDDAILVPCHAGGFISGGDIPIDAEAHKKANMKNLFEHIKQKHYSLTINKKKVLSIDKICRLCETKEINNGIEYASLAELFNWQERQSKSLINCARIYEFTSYEWWFPLWDSHFMYFWQNLPLKYRKNKILFIFLKFFFIVFFLILHKINFVNLVLDKRLLIWNFNALIRLFSSFMVALESVSS